MSHPLDDFEKWLSGLENNLHDVWSEISSFDSGLARWLAQEAQNAPFLVEWGPIVFRGLLSMGITDYFTVFEVSLSVVRSADVGDFITQQLFGFSHDEPRHIRALAQPKHDIIEHNHRYAELIHNEIQALQQLYTGSAATVLNDVDVALSNHLYEVMGQLGSTQYDDDTYATHLERSLQTLAHDIASQQHGEIFSSVAFLWGGAIAQGGIDVPWDVVAVIATVIAACVSVGIKAYPYIKASHAIADAREEWGSRSHRLQEPAKIIPFPQPNGGPPFDPRTPQFGDWLNRSAWVLAILSGAVTITIIVNHILTASQQHDLQELEREFPNVLSDDIARLLAAGLTADQIRALLKAGFATAYIKQHLDDLQQMLKAQFSQDNLVTIATRIHQAELNGHDQYGLTSDELRVLFRKIADYYFHVNDGAQETVAITLHFTDRIVGFQIDQYVNGKKITDFDIVLPEAIIEVKTGKRAQPKQTVDQVALSKGKPVVVYGPQITTRAAKQELRNAGAAATANNLSDLDIILKAIREGITDPDQLNSILQKVHGK